MSKGIEKGLAYAAERYLTKVVGSRLAGGLLSEGTSPMQLVNAVKKLKALGYTDDVLRELADNISASQLVRLSRLNSQGLSRDILDVLMLHSRKLGSYSDDLIWKLEKAGGYYDDILKLVDDYGEVFVHQLDTEELTRLGRLAKEGLPSDVAEAVIKHIDNFADYSDDTIKKIVESGCNADRILTQIDEYAKDFTEDLTAGQLKRVDDILEQGITPEQFEVLLQHADGLENYTDEIVELWRNYGGNSDDFLKLVDEFGEDFVEAFKANGDEAVEGFKIKLEIIKKTGLTQVQIDEIVNTAKESRPDPSTYLTQEYIQMHLEQFNDGVSVIQTEWAYSRYTEINGFVGVPDDNTLFVMPKSLCDEVIFSANGDISIIEKELGFPKGYFSDGGGLVRIDVDDISGLNIRMPSGKETGANNLWLPGGYTSGGVPEAVTDTIPLSRVEITKIEVD